MKIGLEVHVALPTKSKLFCSCSTSADEPNSAICPICMGLPGSRPMLNGAALEFTITVANALHCRISKETYFLRKVYFYPDLPKSYQITQLDGAVGHNGYVRIKNKKIRIRRVQLEEDPAKIVREDEYSLLDFNRSGIPLNEIVTEPDMESESELREFVNELRSILYYVGIDIDKEMKIDLNISLGEERVEVKNITGIKNLIDAERFEERRQSQLIESNQPIKKETRSYNAETMMTVSSREKESDEEYGFIYEPDLAIYSVDVSRIRSIESASEIATSYSKKYGANEDTIRELIMFDKDALRLLEEGVKHGSISNTINAIELLKRHGKISMPGSGFKKMLEYLEKGFLLNETAINALHEGREINTERDSVKTEVIDNAILEIVKQRQDLVNEYKTNKKAFNFIVGIILKKYSVNPKYVSERLAEVLKNDYGIV
jgi:aspartyl-tRNA(Asn)/glutamyl-tRNA(Gln) amidotransferase subunit B